MRLFEASRCTTHMAQMLEVDSQWHLTSGFFLSHRSSIKQLALVELRNRSKDHFFWCQSVHNGPSETGGRAVPVTNLDIDGSVSRPPTPVD
jgi:hypothetical protein